MNYWIPIFYDKEQTGHGMLHGTEIENRIYFVVNGVCCWLFVRPIPRSTLGIIYLAIFSCQWRRRGRCRHLPYVLLCRQSDDTSFLVVGPTNILVFYFYTRTWADCIGQCWLCGGVGGLDWTDVFWSCVRVNRARVRCEWFCARLVIHPRESGADYDGLVSGYHPLEMSAWYVRYKSYESPCTPSLDALTEIHQFVAPAVRILYFTCVMRVQFEHTTHVVEQI